MPLYIALHQSGRGRVAPRGREGEREAIRTKEGTGNTAPDKEWMSKGDSPGKTLRIDEQFLLCIEERKRRERGIRRGRKR